MTFREYYAGEKNLDIYIGECEKRGEDPWGVRYGVFKKTQSTNDGRSMLKMAYRLLDMGMMWYEIERIITEANYYGQFYTRVIGAVYGVRLGILYEQEAGVAEALLMRGYEAKEAIALARRLRPEREDVHDLVRVILNVENAEIYIKMVDKEVLMDMAVGEVPDNYLGRLVNEEDYL